MAGVRAGGDRQDLHERIRQHSLAASEQVKQHGRPNDLLNRIQSDPTFNRVDLSEVLDPAKFIGRAVEQTERFVAHQVSSIRARYQGKLGKLAELKV